MSDDNKKDDAISRAQIFYEVKRLADRLDAIEDRQANQISVLFTKQGHTEAEVETIKAWLSKYKGFLGGIVFVFTIFWAIMLFLKSALLKMVTA